MTDESRFDTLTIDDPRLEDVVRLECEAFGVEEKGARRFVAATGPDVWRVWQTAGRVQGMLALYPMGQWFGGRVVPMWGVACVAIDPADRGGGVGTEIMQAAVREMHTKGIALSALYPAVQPLYRRAGYERAGNAHSTTLDLAKIAPVDRSAKLRQGTADDEPALELLERGRARLHDGNIDRGAFMWRRARRPGGSETTTHVVLEDGAITGYVRACPSGRGDKRRIFASEVVASTPVAARRLLAFFADNAAQIGQAFWQSHPTEAMQCVADSQCFKVKHTSTWMLRLTHVGSALNGRGYPPGLSAEVHLDVEDDLCPDNAGRWTLRVADGVGTAERGGEGRIGLHVRQLATIYSGHAHPRTVRAAHEIAGSDAELATLGAVFAGGNPWMQDAF